MDAIATIRSCYSQRFGIPRQPGLVDSAVAAIEFEPTRDNELALRDLGSFSHLWVVFVFHSQHYTRFKPLVQPPRLGGKTTMGVYATRSPNRPNPIGLSVVALREVTFDKDLFRVYVDGGDFLDGTPVLDIKPYVPFIDAIPDARSDWATPLQDGLEVAWKTEALQILDKIEPDDNLVASGSLGLKSLIEQTLAQDPRPAHERSKDGKQGQLWGVMIGPVDVRFKVEGGVAIIEVVEPK
ncbi:tRNA (adenine(37)-N6)-methyltransferase [Granulosicoccus antarcticus IMCC3135]|uniref:tRNA (Adenine(37)-N6)-methyltransferase n=2 Tax=Granulosicoccus TaxID=437504 RepID=A0A2Z2NH47_9GAMM|nr:tRNA (adenine(37)-N6)-methyltransferase [Granulosicoccus antarcticus IMCC3135]